jgi:hypothetical protein
MHNLEIVMSFFLFLASGVASAAVYVAIAQDRRSIRRQREILYSIRNTTWKSVQNNPLYYDGWFKRNLRCSFTVFNKICNKIEAHWYLVNKIPGNTTVFSIRDRVAVSLYYLMNGGTFHSAGNVFGISKTRTIAYVNEVIRVLLTYRKNTIKLPNSYNDWKIVVKGFEKICGFPNVCGAIDGTLIPVKVTGNSLGWFCRKNFTALNMQAVVDHNMKFMSYSIRSGSNNDKSLFNNSSFGKNVHKKLMPGTYFLADAGYQLFNHVLTPYKIVLNQPADESKYNYLHSKSRIIVECAFGLWKSTFGIFRSRLQHGSPEFQSQIVLTTIVLHNWLIDLKNFDEFIVPEPEQVRAQQEEWMHIGGDSVSPNNMNKISGDDSRNFRDTVKEYLSLLE